MSDRIPYRRAASAATVLACLVGLALACGSGVSPGGPEVDVSRSDLERYVRYEIQRALAFRSQSRLESAEMALRRAVAADPDHPRALRLLAVVLDELGNLSEAQRVRARADEIAPLPPLPPDEALEGDAEGLLVAIVPLAGDGEPDRVRGDWPDGVAHRFLARRVRTRLSGAESATIEAESVADARRWLAGTGAERVLSLRIDRAYCGDTAKDGPFAVSWVRYALASPDRVVVYEGEAREVVLLPLPPELCVPLSLGRAFERVLADPEVARHLHATARESEPGAAAEEPTAWRSRSVRALFPALGDRIAAHLERGRARLATGRILEAADAFRQAARIDPEDLDVRAYLREAEFTLEMAGALGASDPSGRGEGAPTGLDPQLTAAQRHAAETLLAEERRMRDELLAALAVLEPDGRAPSDRALDALRPVPIQRPDALGPRLARAMTERPIEMRALFTPSGEVLARYYFEEGGRLPLLRENDSDGSGDPDEWVAYDGGDRREVWQDRQGMGEVDLHMVFANQGATLERLEIDSDGDGRFERIFRYEDGRLVSEARDTNADGRLDRFETFDLAGYVIRRDEDLDGDGEIDLRSFYREGALVRREILDNDALDKLL